MASTRRNTCCGSFSTISFSVYTLNSVTFYMYQNFVFTTKRAAIDFVYLSETIEVLENEIKRLEDIQFQKGDTDDLTDSDDDMPEGYHYAPIRYLDHLKRKIWDLRDDISILPIQHTGIEFVHVEYVPMQKH